MTLDTRSLSVVAGCVPLLIGLLQLLAWRRHNSFPGSVGWTLGTLCLAASSIMIVIGTSTRNYLPHWASFLGGTVFAALAPILVLDGTRQFCGRRPRLSAAYASGAAVIIGSLVFTYVWPSANLRIFLVNGHIGTLFLLSGATLLWCLPPALALGGRFTAAVFALIGGLMIVRAVFALFGPRLDGLFVRYGPSAGFYLAGTLLFIAASFGFFLLAHQHLLLEIRNAEWAASQMARRLEIAVQASSAGLWDWDFGAKQFYFSPLLKSHLGYGESEAMDTSFKGFVRAIHPQDREQFRHLETNVASHAPLFIEFRLRTTRGEYRWFRSQGQTEWDTAGKPIHMAGSIVDISEERAIREKLRVSEERLALAIDSSALGLWDWNVQNGNLYVSDALEKMLGYACGQMPRTRFSTMIHPDDRMGDARALDPHLAGSIPDYRSEYRMCDSRGEWKWILARGRVVARDLGGVPLRMVGTLSDVTRRRQLEEDLRRAVDAAQAANRAKGEFLANMSHEIRTPMNGIMGMTHLLMDTELDPDQRDFANTIRYSADSLLNLINDILDFSKIEAGKLELEEVSYDVREPVESSTEMQALKAEGKGIKLYSMIEAGVPLVLLGDPGRLRQVLVNLVSNALKFTERGEVAVHVTVRASAFPGSAADSPRESMIRCEVRDTGIGVSEEIQPLLFQAFTQADGSTTRRFGGTGLGLSISKRLIEMMGGTIGMHSQPGHGSTFWFEIPMREGDWCPADSRQNIAGRRVLIVDDDELDRTVLRHHLSRAGLRYEEASCPSEALARLRGAVESGQPFDFAVIDYQLPELDGIALGRRILTEPAWKNTCLIMVTAFGDRKLGRGALAEGFRGYLTKPLKESSLINVMQRALDHKPGDRPDPSHGPVTPGVETGAASYRILLAEDNAVNQKLMLRVLAKMGHAVDVVADGRQAVEAALRMEYDVILMDCQMPELDGFEATAEIRRKEPAGRRVSIIALTANAMKGDSEQCLAAGMDDYLPKPVDLALLKQMLGRWAPATVQARDTESVSMG